MYRNSSNALLHVKAVFLEREVRIMLDLFATSPFQPHNPKFHHPQFSIPGSLLRSLNPHNFFPSQQVCPCFTIAVSRPLMHYYTVYHSQHLLHNFNPHSLLSLLHHIPPSLLHHRSFTIPNSP